MKLHILQYLYVCLLLDRTLYFIRNFYCDRNIVHSTVIEAYKSSISSYRHLLYKNTVKSPFYIRWSHVKTLFSDSKDGLIPSEKISLNYPSIDDYSIGNDQITTFNSSGSSVLKVSNRFVAATLIFTTISIGPIHSSFSSSLSSSYSILSPISSYAIDRLPYRYPSDISSNDITLKLSENELVSSDSPQILRFFSDSLNRLRSGVTGEKVTEIRVGESLVRRLRAVEQELDQIQRDIFAENVDWEVLSVYPKIFRTYAPLFTAYTDRAFPSTSSPVDTSLRYALRYEIGGFYNGVKDFEDAVEKRSQRQLQRAFARISLSYDRYYKAGDLYYEYDRNDRSLLSSNTLRNNIGSIESTGSVGSTGTISDRDRSKNLAAILDQDANIIPKLSYIAPSIEAPSLQDEVILLKGPDKGRKGVVLWIAKGDNIEASNVVIKLETTGISVEGHQEVKLYPYAFVAKTTPPEVQFFDDLLAAYVASAISCGIMYPIDSYKTRLQIGKRGLPSSEEGGFFGLYKGVQYFVADANDAVYVASYGLIKPLFLMPVDPTNSVLVFTALVLSGSAGDALGSVFRVPMEIVYKRVQAGLSNDGMKVLLSLGSKALPIRTLLICWAAVLLRDMPFAGLQIALYDIYKSLFSFLDEAGWSMFAQSALWGVLAGGTAAYLTTPFDVLTTNILTAIEEPSTDLETVETIAALESTEPMTPPQLARGNINTIDSDRFKANVQTARYFMMDTMRLFQKSFNDVVSSESSLNGKINALFNGAFERVLFFGPAAMIFFTTYESAFNIISVARERHGLWF